ncbi:hypothetical protein [Phenylobacterium sp. J367]|uniref:hypothetical protein n=1 Tax=Phenylobacterium sp. J367 TaxID=2898435 RepID=UPI002151C711|nr:hypothetical protein [Phenylobacterium sp. J367]MCR5876968.1 hypothetical protein [Phenylobacterium sp. J367]MCR5877036.1 hypothetical protein [Phenylobacterium sp. J367]
MNVTDLGFTADELRTLVIERAADKLCAEVLGADTADYAEEALSAVDRKIKAHIDEAITPLIDAAIAKHVEPYFSSEIEKLVFEETNRWGEKVGKTLTFREMVIERAQAYIEEPVSYDGKAKSQDSYNWRPNTTRIAYEVDKHIQYEISVALKDAIGNLNSSIASGLAGAVKVSLAQAVEGVKVAVTTK